MWISVNKDRIVTCVSSSKFIKEDDKVIFAEEIFLVGDRYKKKAGEILKIAVISDYLVPCGISTFAEYLVEELDKIADVKIFAENHRNNLTRPEMPNVVRCWERSETMDDCVEAIKKWGCDLILVNFEWGMFPKSRNLLKFIQDISDVPNIFICHSIFKNHDDKNVILSMCPNLIVHSHGAKEILANAGVNSNIHIIRHGRNLPRKAKRPWQMWGECKKIISYGFLLDYKNIESIIEAVEILKKEYDDILFICFGSWSNYLNNIHLAYYYRLQAMIKEKKLQNNIFILTGFFSDQVLESAISLCDVCVFAHKKMEDNECYGASGSISLPLSLQIPTIASGQSFQFEEFKDVIARPLNSQELALEIRKIFAEKDYAKDLVRKANLYVTENSWKVTARKYLELIKEVIES